MAALSGNILRSSFLSIMASRQGMAAVPEWHDSAGGIVLVITFAIVVATAFVWRAPLLLGRNRVEGEQRTSRGNLNSGNLPRFLIGAMIMLLFASMILTEAWFRMHDLPRGSAWGWTIDRRSAVDRVVQVPIAPATLRMLFHPEGFSERWIGPGGEIGQVFVFQWPSGRTALQSVQMHKPEVCLASMGMHLEKRLSDFQIGDEGNGLRLRAWLFSQQGEPVYVFYSIFEQNAGSAGESRTEDQTISNRFETLKAGKRNRAQRMVEVAFWNLHNEDEARAALARYLSQCMRMTSAPFTNPQQNPKTP